MRIDSGRVEGVRRAAAADGDDLAREVVAQEQPDDLRGDDLRFGQRAGLALLVLAQRGELSIARSSPIAGLPERSPGRTVWSPVVLLAGGFVSSGADRKPTGGPLEPLHLSSQRCRRAPEGKTRPPLVETRSPPRR